MSTRPGSMPVSVSQTTSIVCITRKNDFRPFLKDCMNSLTGLQATVAKMSAWNLQENTGFRSSTFLKKHARWSLLTQSTLNHKEETRPTEKMLSLYVIFLCAE